MMHGPEKSDLAIVAGKPANKAEQSAAESVERRAGTKGMRTSKARAGRRAGCVSQAPERIRQAFAVTQPKVGAVCGKAARTVLCGGRAMKRTSLPLHNCDFVGGPLIALAASRLALRAPRRGGGFGHDPAPVTAHNAPFPSYKNRLAKTKPDGGERCETNWSFLRSCLGC